MKERMQKTLENGCLRMDSSENEDYVGVQTFMGITENHLMEVHFTKDDLLERIISPSNLNLAYKQVRANGGSGGVDKMETEDLLPYLKAHKDFLIDSLMDGSYHPNPVRRVEIPKEDGKTRQLGIPTVVDRLIQQAISQVLSPIYEREFSDTSYGFRPKRSAHKALRKAQSYVTAGYKYAVAIDLEKFFDTVNQSKLIEVLSKKIKDGRVLSLIHKYMGAGVVVYHTFEESGSGVPQGGPLSPLLSNILLNELDKELERRGHKYVRYADDGMIFCKSKRAAERTKEHIIHFIENKLFLKVNRSKTKVGYVQGMTFLGYSFYVMKGNCRLSVHPKSAEKMQARLKELTSRSNGWGSEVVKLKLKQFIVGWVEYFKLADMKQHLIGIDKWLRRRIRMYIWKSWKKTATRFRNLIRCGINKHYSWMWANTRKGYWHTAASPILERAINTDNLRKTGYLFLSDYYCKVSS
ncbi:MAG: group II intron reverse transcriptase/maturase [Bacteroidales bacterium]|nr:group II intron reverse transcriptase/maturase [Bacteroidales bacterium]